MERSIRIGKDFNVRWSIRKVVDGERQPYELAGKELVLQYRTPYGIKEATEWKVVGNTIVWTFRGKEQKALGSYELILTENGGKDGMVTVDTRRAFKLVAHSCEETEGSGCDIVIEDVVLESEVAFAPVVVQGDDTAIWEALASQEQLIEDLQNMKIDREADDYYPKMAVGLADNLAGVDVVDSEINFRRSGGGAITDGVARIETIKGNSVVWNQHSKRVAGVYGDVTGNWARTKTGVNDLIYNDGTFRIVVEDTTTQCPMMRASIVFPAGHKVIVSYDVHVSGEIADNSKVYLGYFSSPTQWLEEVSIQSLIGKKTTSRKIVSLSSDTIALFLGIYASLPIGTVLEYSNVRVIDLTQMFGAGNEPTTIEGFYARIPQGVDLNAYNEGEVIHMDVQSIESQGVNAWDEEMESGALSTTNGEPIASIARMRSTNFIKVVPNREYWISCPTPREIFCYDAQKNFIKYYGKDTESGLIFPNGCHYIKFSTYSSYGTTYKGDICINISDTSVNGKYFPYIKRVEDLAVIRKYFPDKMKSAGSAHDEIRYNKASGKWEKVQSVGEIGFSGARAYTIENTFLLPIADMKAPTINPERGTGLLCAKYPMHDGTEGYNVANMQDKSMLRMNNGYIYIKDSAFGSDATAFKAAMAGVILYYELAEPIITELDKADQFKDLDYQVWNAGTEKAIAEGKSAPLAADITYGFNAIGKIKEIESLVAALRAKVGI